MGETKIRTPTDLGIEVRFTVRGATIDATKLAVGVESFHTALVALRDAWVRLPPAVREHLSPLVLTLDDE